MSACNALKDGMELGPMAAAAADSLGGREYLLARADSDVGANVSLDDGRLAGARHVPLHQGATWRGHGNDLRVMRKE